MEKERVDILVVQQGLTDSREKAKRLVMAGQIVDAVNHNRYDKPGEKIPVTSSLMIKGEPLKYVSRGGLKLEKAINELGFSVKDKVKSLKDDEDTFPGAKNTLVTAISTAENDLEQYKDNLESLKESFRRFKISVAEYEEGRYTKHSRLLPP